MYKDYIIASIIIVVFGLFFWWLAASSFFDINTEQLKEFETDKCTLLFSTAFDDCCVEHDKAYWMGGAVQERIVADKKLKNCVQQKTKSYMKATLIYGAVRIGGVPFVATPWRWGYGWKFGRGYYEHAK